MRCSPKAGMASLCVFVLVALISGCSTLVSDERETMEGTAAPVEDASTGARSSPVGGVSPAVVALLDQAAVQQRGGRQEQSAATLERALRIEPRNPWLWYRLAGVRLEMGMARRAEQLALKSKALAVGNPRLVADNWRLIARARERLGDAQGARQARTKADQP